MVGNKLTKKVSMKLLERKIINSIRKFINSKDVVVLHGARQVGKTSILKFLQEELNLEIKIPYILI